MDGSRKQRWQIRVAKSRTSLEEMETVNSVTRTREMFATKAETVTMKAHAREIDPMLKSISPTPSRRKQDHKFLF